jgi:hypothetical protein
MAPRPLFPSLDVLFTQPFRLPTTAVFLYLNQDALAKTHGMATQKFRPTGKSRGSFGTTPQTNSPRPGLINLVI